MNIYYVFSNIKFQNTDIRYNVFVKDGFCFYAFLFNIFWFFYKKMWTAGFLSIMLYAYTGYLINKYTGSIYYSYVVNFFINIIIGLFANDLLCIFLKRNGYKFSDVVIATNELEANINFLKKYIKNKTT